METSSDARPGSSKNLDRDARDTPREITNADLYAKLIELEGKLSGKFADLLTPNEVYLQYGITPMRLKRAVKAKRLLPKDVGCPVKGGGKSFRVKRADVEIAFGVTP
jgi:hypothetical protein